MCVGRRRPAPSVVEVFPHQGRLSRLSKIQTLKWECRRHRIHRTGLKTGAKPIPLNGPALEVLAGAGAIPTASISGGTPVCSSSRRPEVGGRFQLAIANSGAPGSAAPNTAGACHSSDLPESPRDDPRSAPRHAVRGPGWPIFAREPPCPHPACGRQYSRHWHDRCPVPGLPETTSRSVGNRKTRMMIAQSCGTGWAMTGTGNRATSTAGTQAPVEVGRTVGRRLR